MSRIFRRHSVEIIVSGIDIRLMRLAHGKDPVKVAPGARTLVPTGLAIALPEGYEAQVRPRSGLATRNGLTILNSPGTIDADYRGEIQVLLVNLGSESVVVSRGMRIAQLVIAPVVRAHIVEAASLDKTSRGSGGFGSTGS